MGGGGEEWEKGTLSTGQYVGKRREGLLEKYSFVKTLEPKKGRAGRQGGHASRMGELPSRGKDLYLDQGKVL